MEVEPRGCKIAQKRTGLKTSDCGCTCRVRAWSQSPHSNIVSKFDNDRKGGCEACAPVPGASSVPAAVASSSAATGRVLGSTPAVLVAGKGLLPPSAWAPVGVPGPGQAVKAAAVAAGRTLITMRAEDRGQAR